VKAGLAVSECGTRALDTAVGSVGHARLLGWTRGLVVGSGWLLHSFGLFGRWGELGFERLLGWVTACGRWEDAMTDPNPIYTELVAEQEASSADVAEAEEADERQQRERK
jgi:hypothetical protein